MMFMYVYYRVHVIEMFVYPIVLYCVGASTCSIICSVGVSNYRVVCYLHCA